MSHVDAEAALSLYRRFCKQTERVVEYFSVAKKLQNLLNVSIPNLKHVRLPTSTSGLTVPPPELIVRKQNSPSLIVLLGACVSREFVGGVPQ